MVLLVNRRQILAKIESTYGTDPTPAGTNAIEITELSFAKEGARMTNPAVLKSTLGQRAQSYGGTLGTLTFSCWLRGSGTAGTAPEIDPLLRSCSMGVTNVPATSDTYAPVSTGQESCTIYFQEDGMQHKLTGCRGSFSATLEAGMPAKLSFTMTGHYLSVPTDTALATPTFDATVSPTMVNLSSMTVDSYAASIASLSFDMGMSLAMPAEFVAADGYGEIIQTTRAVTGSIDPLATLVATYDWETKWRTMASVAINTGVVGSTAGNRWQLQFPTAQYIEMNPGDRDGIITRQISFAANENAGDDELSLAFT